MGKALYKRGYEHTIKRGREYRVACDFCKRLVPRYKTFTIFQTIPLGDQTFSQQFNKKVHFFQQRLRACPACARFRRIVQPRKSARRRT